MNAALHKFCVIVGGVGGTVLSIFANLHTEDVAETVVLAGIGAAASFLVSYFLEWVFKRKSPGR